MTEGFNLRLRDGEDCLVGSWITLAHPAIAEIMANAGFDWLAVDMEHSVITIREAEELIRTISSVGVVPLVRLTSHNSDQIKRIMDAGAHGIIVPMVKSANDVLKAVEALKYPPIGRRSIGLARAHGYGTKFQEYVNWEKTGSTLIIQVEHIDAVEGLDEILSIGAVDGYIVGPYDLTSSMGIPGQFDHPKFLTVMEQIQSVAKKRNVTGGIHVIEPNPSQLEQHIREGFRFIAYSLDVRMLDVTCRTGLDHIRDIKS